MGTRIGLLGGSFNPIHVGHLICARAVAERLELDRVFFLPARLPPHKPPRELVSIDDRMAMVRLAIEGEPIFAVSDVDVTRPAPTYTIDTIALLRADFGLAAELFWIIGADSLAELSTWHRATELVDACRVVTLARRGLAAEHPTIPTPPFTKAQSGRLHDDILETPLIDISSTDIRERVRSGKSIRYLVPESVRKYLNKRELYH